jgi:hypothetical protein
MRKIYKNRNREFWPIYTNNLKKNESPLELELTLVKRLQAMLEGSRISDLYFFEYECYAPLSIITSYQHHYSNIENSYLLKYEDDILGFFSIHLINEDLHSDWDKLMAFGLIRNFIRSSLHPLMIEKDRPLNCHSFHNTIKVAFTLKISLANNIDINANVTLIASLNNIQILKLAA